MSATKMSSEDAVHNTRVVTGLLFHSVMMAVLPSFLFLSSQQGYFDVLYQYTIGIPDPDRRSVVSALLAVLGVNLVVGRFVYKAFQEDPVDTKTKIKKKD